MTRQIPSDNGATSSILYSYVRITFSISSRFSPIYFCHHMIPAILPSWRSYDSETSRASYSDLPRPSFYKLYKFTSFSSAYKLFFSCHIARLFIKKHFCDIQASVFSLLAFAIRSLPHSLTPLPYPNVTYLFPLPTSCHTATPRKSLLILSITNHEMQLATLRV